MNSNKDDLIQKIVDAFSGIEFPGDDKLVNPSYDEEPDLVRNHFVGQNNWNKLTPEFIDFDGALSYFSNEAFRFYIPAFMIADIHGELKNNDPTVPLCWSLIPPSETQKIAKVWGGGTMKSQSSERFKDFSEEQISSIIFYLQWKLLQDEYYKNDLIIEQALKNYWLQLNKNA